MSGLKTVMRVLAVSALGVLVVAGAAHAQDSLIVKQSAHGVAETMDRLAAAAEENGLNVFSRIDHSAGAEAAGLDLPPTQLLVVGNPNAGTPLMQADPRTALSLPLRIATWQENGTVWVGYWSPQVLAVQYGITDQMERLDTMAGVLDALTDTATAE
jgi:uncharacterized protein (DUF302 family)